MTIPPRFMGELRDRLALSDIVGRRVKLQRAGGQEYKACCPFHQEKSPSFTLNDDKQFYHCFGCGAHGDVVGFVMRHDNLTFTEAIEMLAAEAGMQVPRSSADDIKKEKAQKDIHALLEETARWFSVQLRGPQGRSALSYMRERGVADALMEQFRIGYAPDDGQALWRHLREYGYDDRQMIEAGVVRVASRDSSPYAFFRDRIVFPVADRRGRVVAFGGRILPEHLRAASGRADDGRKPPKYINSSDSPLFHKGRMLYGESHARQEAADGGPVIVVEGYLDVMSCFAAGYRGAVAPLGTALTEEQILVLWKIIPSRVKLPVLCFDGDNAGRRAAARACERFLPLLQPDQSALFAFLPEGQDPDSLIKAQGAKAFESVIGNAMPLVDFLWMHHTAGRRFETPESRAGLEKALEDDILKIENRAVQQHYRQAFRDRLYKAFRLPQGAPGRKRTGQRNAAAAMTLSRPAFADDTLPCRILLAAIINHPALFDRAEEDLGRLPISNERLDSLRQSILNTLGGAEGLDSQGLKNHLKEQGFESELKALLSESVYTHAGFAQPGSHGDSVWDGWRRICAFLDRKAATREYRAAAAALAQDCRSENEEKLIALHKALAVSGETEF